MIILGLFDVLWWLGNAVGSIVLPNVPPQVTTVLTYILNMINNGLAFCNLVLWDPEVVAPIAVMMITTITTLFAFDLTWRVIYIVTLRHHNNEHS